MSLLMDSLANATPVLKLRIETPVKFSSGNQMEMGKGRLFRSQSYHEYHNYLKAQLDDIYDDLDFNPKDGCAYFLRTMFTYPIPKSYVTSKKAKLEFNSTKILPITRSTIDLDNSEKGTNDVLQEVGADVKIMDRFFRHRELPDSENFSKPGFHLKTA
ncbi:RusA family crossover junction endodeoxyribonuclease [Weissella confusa]|uniref:RusA family crossover junction endodeoxyribonuclease n=1 Tax=Weissella confusa TaxID=1583 RepID=UPI0018F25530|nr:RusA family crossover junction endodeoxyribonuclease [Weissella confusa]MBJ7656665.1 RusA family crossover junction endodeoxyribonuclease [Weissella confusa]